MVYCLLKSDIFLQISRLKLSIAFEIAKTYSLHVAPASVENAKNSDMAFSEFAMEYCALKFSLPLSSPMHSRMFIFKTRGFLPKFETRLDCMPFEFVISDRKHTTERVAAFCTGSAQRSESAMKTSDEFLPPYTIWLRAM